MNLDICFSCTARNTKCSICKFKVSTNHRHIDCTKCHRKVHIKCNNTDFSTYNNLQSNKILCINCKPDNFPFQDLSDVLFLAENTLVHIDHKNTTHPKVKCFECTKHIAKNHRKLKCNFCDNHFHIKCNGTDIKTYNAIQKQNLIPVCKICHPLHRASHNLPPLKPVTPKISCNACLKTIAVNHRKVFCSCCQKYSHIKCNKIDTQMFDRIIKNDDSILCATCKRENIPFHELNDIQLSAITKCIEINSEILDEALIKSSTLTNFF